MKREANTDPSPDAELDPSVAAKILGIQKNTLRRWADAGLVPVIRLNNGFYRYRRGDMEEVRQRMISG